MIERDDVAQPRAAVVSDDDVTHIEALHAPRSQRSRGFRRARWLLRRRRGGFHELCRDAPRIAWQERVDLLLFLEKSRGRGDGVRSALAEEGFRRLLVGQRIIGAVDFVEDLLNLGAVEVRDLLGVRRPGLVVVRVLAEMRIGVERDLSEGLEDVGMGCGVVLSG